MVTASDIKSSPVLLVAIVNYRTPQLTIDCLQSLVSEVQALPGTKVVVSDNLSGDDSVEKIQAAIAQENWGDWVSFMPLEKNGGFAYGNNEIIRPALNSDHPPKYVLLLNPDTIVRPGALTSLVKFMDENPEVGIAGSRLEDPDGTPQRSAFRFHTLFSEIESGLRLGIVSKLLEKSVVAPPVTDETCPTDWVAGASMIVRRCVFDKIGLMDDDYFMYYEEMDFCLQANRAGWPCWYVPESHVVHLVGQSSGVTDTKKPPKRLPKYWFESRKRYFTKNYGRVYAALSDILWIVCFALWRVRRIVQQKPDTDPPNFLQDFIKNSGIWDFFNSSELENKASPSFHQTPELGLWEQIKEDWIAHERDWTRPGFRAVAVQRFGVWRMTLKSPILRAPMTMLYRALFRKMRNTYGIELPYTVNLGRRVIFEHQHGIVIHGYSTIGDDSIIRQGVTLGNRYLDKPFDAPKLGKRVNVGAGAKILGGVTIGDDACIGANAVVLTDIPAGETAVGIPAKIISRKKAFLS